MSPKDEDWADALDAITAAPQYHLVLLENDAVRVLDTTVPPGHTVPLHTHCWSSVNYILELERFHPPRCQRCDSARQPNTANAAARRRMVCSTAATHTGKHR